MNEFKLTRPLRGGLAVATFAAACAVMAGLLTLVALATAFRLIRGSA